MTRMQVLREIDRLQLTCVDCPTKRQNELKYGSHMYARIDGYCNRECAIGKQIQEFGRQLVRERQPMSPARQERRAIMLAEMTP